MAFDFTAFDELCEEALAAGPPSLRDVVAANAVPLACVDNEGNVPEKPTPNTTLANDDDWNEFWYGVGYPDWLEPF